MTIEEIELIELDQERLDILVARMFDLSIIPEDETAYTLDIDENMEFFDRIYFNKRLNAPDLARFEQELEEYRNELKQVEYERLSVIAEAEREAQRLAREAYFARVEALNIRKALVELGEDVPNTAFKRIEIMNDDNEAELARLEAAYATVQAREAQEAAERQLKETSKRVREICNRCTEIVIEYNLVSGLTSQQKDDQAATYAAAMEALRQWRPMKFKNAIEAMVVDPVLAPAALRDKLVAYLVSEGL